MTLPTLIEALKSAKGPSIELDGLVIEACGGAYNKNARSKTSAYGRMPGDDPEDGYYRLPTVTGSIDAAVSLVERVRPGWCLELEYFPYASQWNAVIYHTGNIERTMKVSTKATPALALLIAILSSMEEG